MKEEVREKSSESRKMGDKRVQKELRQTRAGGSSPVR